MATSIVLFSGIDSKGREAIWRTNGTVAGTLEIKVLYGTSNSPYGDFVQYGSNILFEGQDSRAVGGLFITNGTSAGTKEITVNGGSRDEGLNPTDLTVSGSKVFFSAIDSNDNHGLWISNGTTAGTKEIAGTTKLNPSNLLAFKGKVLFAAALPTKGLWISDGTASGTKEIAGTATLLPREMTIAGGKAYFVDGPSGGLYTTDGTAAGTKGLIYTGASVDLTAFGSRLAFESMDNNGHRNLYITNGTTAGTIEVPGTIGLFDKLVSASKDGGGPLSPDFTMFDGKLLFEADDTRGGFGLWVSDGTKAGTHEIAGIKGAQASGIFASPGNPNFNGPDFAVYGKEVVFDGVSSAGLTDLWVTNGTAAGTHELKGIKGAGFSGTKGLDPSNMTTVTVPTPSAAAMTHHTAAFAAALFEGALGQSAVVAGQDHAIPNQMTTSALAASANDHVTKSLFGHHG